MKEFIEKLIGRLEELKRVETDREDYVDENGHYNDVEEAFGDGESNGRYQAYCRVEKIVNQLAEEYNNGWIPCSERLPEVFDNVLICTKEGGRAIGHRCPNQKPGRYYDLHSSAIDNVIAWQPLPEPYHPKGE